jgi:peptidoglycan/LPS O-acetylase OafA/YrhL
MNYRSEIDGLRAFAIIPVLLYHLNKAYAPNGFLGVDVFFVISGFLIANIISQKINEGTFSVKQFYIRRIKRIAPLYIAVMFLLVPASLLIYFPSELKDIFQSISASIVFVSNFFFYREIDYFNPFAQNSPLIHTWSLSIEEQFYIFLPALLIFTKGKVRSTLIIGLTILSLLYYVVINKSNPNLSFYSTFSRIWELLIGVLVAVNSKKMTFSFINHSILSTISFICLLIILFTDLINIDINILRISIVFITIYILIQSNSLVTKFLSYKPFVQIGLLSYSLYMIHQPILSIFKRFFPDTLSYSIILMSVIFLISYLSYNFFEKPIRYSVISSKKVLVIFCSCSMILFSIGVIGHKENGFINFFLKKYENTNFFNDVKEYEKISKLHKSYNIDEFSKFGTNVLIIGDSYAGDVFSSLKTIGKEKDLNNRLYSIDDNCFEILLDNLNSNNRGKFECENKPYYPDDLISDILNSDLVIITAYWNDRTIEAGVNLSNYITGVLKKKVLIIGSVGFTRINSITLDALRKDIPDSDFNSYIRTNHIVRSNLKVSDRIPDLITNKDIYYLSKYDFFCNSKGCSLFYNNGNPKIWDFGHLTVHSLRDYGMYINQKIEKIIEI